MRKDVIEDFIRVKFTSTEDAKLLAKRIRLMKSEFKGKVELRTQQAKNSEIWKDELEIVQ